MQLITADHLSALNLADYRDIAVRGIIITRDNAIWLERRDDSEPHNAGQLGCFGGRLETGQTVAKALEDELLQEVGLTPGDMDVTPVCGITRVLSGGKRLVVYHLVNVHGRDIIHAQPPVGDDIIGKAERFNWIGVALADPSLGRSPAMAMQHALDRGFVAPR